MVILTAVATAGSYHTDVEVNQVTKPTGAGTDYAVGSVVYLDASDDTYKITPIDGSARGPFGVVVNKRPLTTDTKMDVAISGHVTVTAAAGIARHNYVATGTTLGRVIEYAANGSPTATTAGTEFRAIVGKYIGLANGNERDGGAVPNAVANDIIWVKLGLGGGGV